MTRKKKIEAISKAIQAKNKSTPSFSFMPDNEINDLYNEHVIVLKETKTNALFKPTLETADIDMSTLTIEKGLSEGGSGGNLPKWLLQDSRGLLYAKGRSKENTLEPEAEVCAYELAQLFGMPAIKYNLVNLSHLPTLPNTPVCVSRDYSCGKRIMSLYRYVEGISGVNPATLNGIEKFKLVSNTLSPKDKDLHLMILYFDYLVGNKDRHLRNFDVWLDAGGNFLGLVHLYDTGACLFSDESERILRMACKQSDNYVHAKPYADPHSSQLRLLSSMDFVPNLNKVNTVHVYKIINKYFEKKRAKYLAKYVILNMERLGLLQ